MSEPIPPAIANPPTTLPDQHKDKSFISRALDLSIPVHSTASDAQSQELVSSYRDLEAWTRGKE
jgi:predicted RNA methylase